MEDEGYIIVHRSSKHSKVYHYLIDLRGNEDVMNDNIYSIIGEGGLVEAFKFGAKPLDDLSMKELRNNLSDKKDLSDSYLEKLGLTRYNPQKI